MFQYRKLWLKMLSSHYTYCTTNMTRLYIRYKNKNVCKNYFKLLMSIWENKDIVIVEGSKTRLGVGNDLFNNAASLERIICPATNAYDKYDQILEEVKKVGIDKTILIALGPTATVLAYDLSQLGYCAIDVGHCDIEYEWFLAGADKKITIDHKYVNEVIDGSRVGEYYGDSYEKQIKCFIS